MSGYVPNIPKGYRHNGEQPVDTHAQRWAEYKDLPPKAQSNAPTKGCVFSKSCDLADGVIDYKSPAGFIPVESVTNYGKLFLLGGHGSDAAGNTTLKKISGDALPAALGTLLLGGTGAAVSSCGVLCTVGAAGGTGVATGSAATGIAGGTGVITAGVAAGALAGIVALLWPSGLGDSSLYTEEQLQSLEKARTRVRLRIEQQDDGTLKGYGYNTQKRNDWEMVPVVHFMQQGAQQVADFGDGVTLIWTPAVDPSSTSGIPPLEGAPQAPQIWIYPPTEQADRIIVSPIYPDQYKDFILVFPADSGVQPLYIVMNVRLNPGIVTGKGTDVTGIWLAGAGTELGSPIPTRIADQLRGKSFSSFDAFRKAFWIAVGNDPELASQFNDSNRARMLEGMAPRARAVDTVGKRRSYELHHEVPVSEGGEVYDVDNLSAMTPKHHIDTHRSSK